MKESQKNKAIVAQVKAKALTNADFRKKLLADPTAALRAAGAAFGKDVQVKVVENTEKIRYLVLPFIEGGKLSEKALAAIAAGESTATTSDTVQTSETEVLTIVLFETTETNEIQITVY